MLKPLAVFFLTDECCRLPRPKKLHRIDVVPPPLLAAAALAASVLPRLNCLWDAVQNLVVFMFVERHYFRLQE